jgi:GWxTD domain-containing protein
MKSFVRWFIMGIISAGLALPVVVAQDAQSSADQSKKQEDDAKKPPLTKDQIKKLYKELDSTYKTWLNEDVVYIITPEERTAFLQMATNEEREQFIENFWLRRDPTPDTPENEFKEEHYRRIAYTNERYSSGIPGWKTDRGRIYIIWGPPDSKDEHPAGGPYTRTPEEGGGETSTYPFEDWHYNYLEGVGNNIDLEFVDPTGSGEYHLTTDPSEKDALTYVPGAGLSDMEAMGLADQTQRFTRTDGTHSPTSVFDASNTDNEFSRIEQYAKVQQAPPVKFKDLSELVTARIVRNQINFNCRQDFFRITSDSDMVPITVLIPNNQISFQEKNGVHEGSLNLFARISTLGGRIVQTFEETLPKDFPDTLFQQELTRQSVYSKALPLKPGLYRLDIVIKDVQSGNVGVENIRLAVPRFEDEKIDGSRLILADDIEKVPAKQVGTGMFVLGDTKVRPKVQQEFFNDQPLGMYLQVYNLKEDEKTHKNNVVVTYCVTRGDQEVFKSSETSEQLKQTGIELTLEARLPLQTFQPGKYKLEISVNDQVANQTLTRTEEFSVKAPVQERASN